MKMKWRQCLAGLLAGALTITGIPFSGGGAFMVRAALQADEEMNLQYRYRPVDEKTITVDTDVPGNRQRPDKPLTNLISRSGYMLTENLGAVSGKNIYFSLEGQKLLGSVRYLSAVPRGAIKKCRLWVSTADREPKDIDESGWLLVYETEGDGWAAHSEEGNNSHEARFRQAQMARHVRLEVLETYGNGTTDANKFISGERVYINEAGRIDQQETTVNVALNRSLEDGDASVRAYTGGNGLNSINGGGNNEFGENAEDDKDYWKPTSHVDGSGDVNYIIYDLHATETRISGISLRWHEKEWASAYTIETSDTCTLGNDSDITGVNMGDHSVPADSLAASGDWKTVVDFDRGIRDSSSDAQGLVQPLDEFTPDNETYRLERTALKRYVRLMIKDANRSPDVRSGGALREIQIWGSRWKVAEAENVAVGINGRYADGRKGSTVIAGYSGADTYEAGGKKVIHSVNYAVDGQMPDGIGSDEYWMPAVRSESGGKGVNMREGDKAYLILDLGEGTVTDIQSMRIKWFGLNSANRCQVWTADTYVPPVGNDNLEGAGGNIIFDGDWEAVATAADVSSQSSDKQLEFREEDYVTKQLKRYVRFDISELNAHAATDLGPNAAISEIEIMGFRKADETGEIHLTVEEPSYGASMDRTDAYPAVGDEGDYIVEDTKWALTSQKGTELHTVFDTKAYTMLVTLKSKSKFTQMTTVTLNDNDTMIAYPYPNESDAIVNYDGKDGNGYSYMTVSYDFGAVESPIEAYNLLKAELQVGRNAADMAYIAGMEKEEAFQFYTKRSWLTFKEAYDDAVFLAGPGYGAELPDEPSDEGAADTEIYYPKKRYEQARERLEREYAKNGEKGLKAASRAAMLSLDNEADEPKVQIAVEPGGQTVELDNGQTDTYSLKNCTWLEKDSDAEAPYPSPYKDYRVKIEVETKEKALEKDSDKDFIFPETASEKNFLYVKNAAGQWERVPVQDILSRELDESGAVLQYIYSCRGLKEPKQELAEYLASHEREEEFEEDGVTAKYTRQSWQAYRAAYDRAVSLNQSSGLKRKQEVYKEALDALKAVVLVPRSSTICECAIGRITYSGLTEIELTAAGDSAGETAEIILNDSTSVLHDRYDCLVHDSSTALELGFELGSGADNTAAGALTETDGKTVLTITKAGEVKVKISARFGSQNAEPKVITFTTISMAEKAEAREEAEKAQAKAQQIYNTGNRDANGAAIYTQESWESFVRAYNGASSLVSVGMERLSSEQLKAAKAGFDGAVARLKTKALAAAEEAARDALEKAVANNDKGLYTEASWAEYVKMKEQLRAELESEQPDAEKLQQLTQMLERFQLVKEPTQAEKELEAARANARAVLAQAVQDKDKGFYTEASWAGYAALKKQLQDALNSQNTSASELNRLTVALAGYKLAKVPGSTPPPAPSPVPVQTYVNIKNVRYEVDAKNKKAAVAVKGTKDAKSITIQKTVKINGVTYKVERIGANAFKGFKKLMRVTVGENIKTIDKQAFMNCKKLKKITLNNGKLLKKIGKGAFKGTKKGLTVKAKKLTKTKARKALLKKVKGAGAKKAKVTK